MQSRSKIAILGFALAVAAAPISFIATLMLVPLWRWVESQWTIEAIGHSGPAEWCYYLVYVALLIAATALYGWSSRDPEGGNKGEHLDA